MPQNKTIKKVIETYNEEIIIFIIIYLLYILKLYIFPHNYEEKVDRIVRQRVAITFRFLFHGRNKLM